ncbi:putative secreted protein associated with spyDAC [Desulfovibrio sp. DV]|uniref:CdaR family protein n=1 Tax=Desulfovibrio sp. DV TaxID=1844708 RepID=UPI00094B8FF8|nr:CdaR family protein [Desulfovibrio sp. DV]OLN29556.1 putative secreted protein associated with spyDAC [Desulfovibrio sp. DV]
MKPNWQYLLLALAMALFCWYLVTGREKVDTWMPMRVEMTGLPEDLYIKSGIIGAVDVLLRGPRGVARKIDESQLVYSLNLSKIVPGKNIVLFEPKNIPLPKVYEVVEIRPTRLELEVERRAVKTVPVKVMLRSSPPDGFSMSAVRAVPDTVRLTGPAGKLEKITEIRTQAITLPQPPPARFDERVPLDVPEDVDVSPPAVQVVMGFAAKESEITLRAPLAIKKPKGREADVAPQAVTLRIKGPAAIISDKDFPGLVEATLELKPDLDPGKYEASYRVKMPQGCELIEAKPDKVSLTVK